MAIAILWLVLFLPVLALAISAAAYIEWIRRRNAALARRLSREADERRDSEKRYPLLMENAPDAIPSEGDQGRHRPPTVENEGGGI